MIYNRNRFAYRPANEVYRPLLLYPSALAILDEPRGPYSIDEAYGYCSRMVRSLGGAENVPVASRFLPPEMRPHVAAVYAFARAADDFADEPCDASARCAALDRWEWELVRAFHGEADHPVFVALRETIERYDLPVTPFSEIMAAMRMDQAISRYATFSELRRYCALSSEPIGRLMLYLFGYRDETLHRYADELCVGLQMAGFIQDLNLDFNGHRGRLYLPLEDLRHFGVAEQDLRGGVVSANFREMMRFQVARARALLERGRPLIDRVGRDISFELELSFQSGQLVLDRIEAVGYDVFHRRPALGGADRARILALALARRWPRFIGRN